MKKQKERPGIILYFDMAAPLKHLENEDKGRILNAMLEYGQYGVVPELDGVLPIVWDCIKPKLDADALRYKKVVIRNTHSSYCAKEKKAGHIPLDFEEWCDREGVDMTTWDRMESCDATGNLKKEKNKENISNSISNENGKSSNNVKVEGKTGGVLFAENEEAMRKRKIAMLENYQ